MLALILHLFDRSGIYASCFLSPPIRSGGAESKPRPLFSVCTWELEHFVYYSWTACGTSISFSIPTAKNSKLLAVWCLTRPSNNEVDGGTSNFISFELK